MTQKDRMRAVMGRDGGADGRFVYAVATTGIYCRPSCPSRRPLPENILFFERWEDAERAGFRPCRRCNPKAGVSPSPAGAMVETVCRAIEARLEAEETPPTLAQLSRLVGLTPHHLQRRFKAALGLSPRQYAEARRMARLKGALKAGAGVSDALYGAGFSSPSRLYERARDELGMTPGVYAGGAGGEEISYAAAPCSLGLVLVAATVRGICAVYLGDEGEAGEARLVADLHAEFPKARIAADGERLGPWLAALVDFLEEGGGRSGPSVPDLPLDVRGTAFQRRVWQELRAIPLGETRSYGEIAAKLGRPRASRAVGRACATNPASVLIPCHRVLSSDGGLNGYRWGLARKAALLGREAARAGKKGDKG